MGLLWTKSLNLYIFVPLSSSLLQTVVMSGHIRDSSVQLEEELAQIRRYEDFSTIGKRKKEKKRKSFQLTSPFFF
jgi:hypothetical protein